MGWVGLRFHTISFWYCMDVILFLVHKFIFIFIVFYIFTLLIFFAFYSQMLRLKVKNLKVNFSTFNLNHLKELHTYSIVWDLNPVGLGRISIRKKYFIQLCWMTFMITQDTISFCCSFIFWGVNQYYVYCFCFLQLYLKLVSHLPCPKHPKR
jgi:hypothetical protein